MTWNFERGFRYEPTPEFTHGRCPRASDYAHMIFEAVPDLERIEICVFRYGLAVFRTPGFEMPQDVIDMVWNHTPASCLFEYSAKIREDWE